MADTDTPIDDALEELERRRRDQWIVAAVLLLAVVMSLALIAFGEGPRTLAIRGAAAFFAVGIGFAISVVLQERRASQLIRTLLSERERSASLSARMTALEAIERAARDLAETDELPEMFSQLLAAVQNVAGAGSGAVLLCADDELTVAAATGPDAPARGHRLPLDAGHAGAAILRDEPVVAGRGAPWGSWTASSVVAVPMRLSHRPVGVLVAARGHDAPAFTPADVAAVALFAGHAALALRNTSRLDEQRSVIARLSREAVERADAVAGLVHDLRSPLAAMSGYVDLLHERDDHFSPQRRQAILGDVRAQVARLRERIDGLMQVTAAGVVVLTDAQILDLSVLAHDAARTARGAALDQRVGRQIVVRTRRPVAVEGDPMALHRAVTNLLDNAVEHTEPGTPIEVTTCVEGDVARLTVRDHGPGLDASVAEHIVLGFPEADDHGHGWGLRVVAAVVMAHGGRLRLQPADGGGTTSVIELPALRRLPARSANGEPQASGH